MRQNHLEGSYFDSTPQYKNQIVLNSNRPQTSCNSTKVPQNINFIPSHRYLRSSNSSREVINSSHFVRDDDRIYGDKTNFECQRESIWKQNCIFKA